MESLILQHNCKDGVPYRAQFLPEHGMNLASFTRGDVEVIAQDTRRAFEERSAGLGPLIGPHFHRRRAENIPFIPDESLFPHIARCKAKGISDPFSHGVARYAPWKAEKKGNTIHAELTGKDLWNGIPLSKIEGQNFYMKFSASLHEIGLQLTLSIVSDTDSLVGIHYYYRLPDGRGFVKSRISNRCYIQGKLMPVPPEWGFNGQDLTFNLKEAADYTFSPAPNPLYGDISLLTSDYQLTTTYNCMCQENGWQLYHPAGTKYVCIEPVSAQDPSHTNLSVSSLHIQLQIDIKTHLRPPG